MFESLDATLLARFQFAFTVSFHIVFPAFTIGLASYLVVLEGLWLATGRGVYLAVPVRTQGDKRVLVRIRAVWDSLRPNQQTTSNDPNDRVGQWVYWRME